MLSEASLGDWDLRRFRSNVILSSGDDDALIGKTVRIGSALLDVVKPIDRCVMVTRAQPGLERDLDVLRTINRERGSFLAVGALVASGGSIDVGDEVRQIEEHSA